MKILVVTDYSSASQGGAQLIAEKVSESLSAAGNNCKTIVYPMKHQRSVRYAKFRGNHLVREVRSIFNPFGIIKIAALQLKYKPEVVWYHNVNNEWSWAALLINLRKSKRLITLHDLTAISNRKLQLSDVEKMIANPKINLHKFRARITKKMIGNVITVSIGETCKEALYKMGFRIDAQIHNRIEPCKHLQPPPRMPKSVLFAGRSYMKGIDILARAVALQEDWTLLIASDHEAYKIALELCPATRISYLGFIPRDNLLQLIHSVELVSVSSQYLDNFPTIGLEALVHGSIPFTTSATGLAEVIGPICRDLVISPGEIPNLNKILDAGITAKNLLGIAASSAQDVDAMINDYLDLIRN